jgi:WD40 repeat protein
MRENMEAELKGDGQNYVDKLEEKMLNNADKDAKEEDKPENNQVAIIDGSHVQKHNKDEPNFMIKPRYDIKGHFDQIRDMFFMDQIHVLASVSEDCQVHLWNLKNICSDTEKLVGNNE